MDFRVASRQKDRDLKPKSTVNYKKMNKTGGLNQRSPLIV